MSAIARKDRPAFAFDSQGRATAVPPPPLPGGLPRAACRIDGADGSIIILLLVRRAATAAVPAIDYTLTFKTTHPLFEPTTGPSRTGFQASALLDRYDDALGTEAVTLLAAALSA